MNLNEDSIKKLDKVSGKNYYFRLDDKNRLTLELTEEKDLQECVGITAYTINQIAKMPSPTNGWVQLEAEPERHGYKYQTLAKTIEQSHKDNGGTVR